jgi:3-hydroxyisobutyrate dehydrogenase-like beta-hydroxyacid dehydrogenase
LGFIGTGSMGAPMSRNLMARGHGLIVRDRRSEATADLIARGAKPAKSPREVADQASTVFACLPDNDSCMEVVLGPDGLVHGKAIKLFVNLGTTGSEFSRRMTERLNERSIAMLDAPISGGASGAEKATLAIMVSGPKAEFDKIEPLLQCMGKEITFVGERPGSAQTMKLANNLLSATAYAITAEAFVMGAKAGLDPEMMVKVINAGSGRNSATADKFPRAVLTRTFDLGATYNIICKDLKLCLAEAEGFGVPMWVGNAVRHLFTCGAAQGGGQRDLTTLVQHLEEQAHTQIPKVR